MEDKSKYEIVVRYDGRESVGRSGYFTSRRFDILRSAVERERRFADEDGGEVLGIRINGFDHLYALDELEASL